MKLPRDLIGLAASSVLIWIAVGLPLVRAQVEPVLDISLAFKPDTPTVGQEVTLTIFATQRRNGEPVSGASVPIMFERALVPMSTMEMMDGVNAVEKSPGIYELGFTFNIAGSYIIHVHVLPKGETNMMRNHSDFGPLLVSGETPSFQFFTTQTLSIVLLGVSTASYAVHRLYRPSRWLKVLAIAFATTGSAIMVATLLTPAQLSSLEPHKIGQQQWAVKIKSGSYMIDQKDNFVPNVVTALIGLNNTITWYNGDGSSHSIVHLDRNPKFASSLLNYGETWTYTFTEPGIYYYYCLPHPWMQGAIVVAKQP